MSKSSASEMLLTVGLLLAASILLIQIRSLILMQEKKIEKLPIERFAMDLNNLLTKSSSATGNILLNYEVPLRNYSLKIQDNIVYIRDKISDKNYSFFVNYINIQDNFIQDSKFICVERLNKDLVMVSEGKCRKFLVTINLRTTTVITTSGMPPATTPVSPTLFFDWPVENPSSYTITSCFGWRYGGTDFHTGIDIAVPLNTQIKAAYDGEVVDIKNEIAPPTPLSGYGNYVKIKHTISGVTYYTFYAHIKCGGVKVNVGDIITKGTLIGLSGGSDNCKGWSTGPHLHFEIRINGDTNVYSANPCLYLSNCNCDTTCERYDQRNDDTKCPKT